MNTILKFYLIVALLLRVLDIITTYVASPDLALESNPVFVCFRDNLHMGGWHVLILYNIAIYIFGAIGLHFLIKNKDKPFFGVAPILSFKEFILYFFMAEKSVLPSFFTSHRNIRIFLCFLHCRCL
jgi:hypothetical protein